MKTIFNKLYKIIFALGIIALIGLVLIVVNTKNDSIDGIWGVAMFACLIIIFVFCMFIVASIVLATIKGFKKDKIAFLKKFLSKIVVVTIAYIVPYILDHFYEFAFSIEFEPGKIALRIILFAFALIGGEYMLADHSKKRVMNYIFRKCSS